MFSGGRERMHWERMGYNVTQVFKVKHCRNYFSSSS